MKQNEFEELQINTALQAAITPVGLEFNRNDFMLGEYFCRVYTVISYPSKIGRASCRERVCLYV